MAEHNALVGSLQKRQIFGIEGRIVWPGTTGENGEYLALGIDHFGVKEIPKNWIVVEVT